MAWDGDWFGAWDGTWFGTESSPPSSISGITSGSGPRRSVTSDAASRALAWLPGQAPRTIDPGRGQRWMTVLNMSGEVIPAWSALEPYGVNGDGVILVRKPTVDDSPTAMLSSGSVIGIGDYGVGTNHMATWAYFHAADGTPSVGESLGTRSGQWKLYRGYEGFLVWGGVSSYRADGNIVTVQRDVTCRALRSGGYYYGDEPCGRRCCCWRCGANRDSNPSDTSGFTGPATIRATVTTACIGTPSTDSVDMTISYCGCETIPCADAGNQDLDMIAWGGTTVDTVSGSCTRCFSTPLTVTWADQPRLTAQLYCRYVPGSASGLRYFQFYWYHWGDTGAVQGGVILGTGGGSNYLCSPFRSGPFQSQAFTCPAVGGVNTTVCLSCVGGTSTILLEQV